MAAVTHQHDTLIALEAEYRHVTIRDASDGDLLADCFDQDPLTCSYCQREPEAPHIDSDDALSLNGSHRFRVALPVAIYQISPDGLRRRVDREGVLA